MEMEEQVPPRLALDTQLEQCCQPEVQGKAAYLLISENQIIMVKCLMFHVGDYFKFNRALTKETTSAQQTHSHALTCRAFCTHPLIKSYHSHSFNEMRQLALRFKKLSTKLTGGRVVIQDCLINTSITLFSFSH